MAGVLFQFEMENIDLTICTANIALSEEIEERVLLQIGSLWYVLLDLPVPGHFNTSTSRSTYDVRGKIDMKFKLIFNDTSRSIVHIVIDIESEDWRYDTFDDKWSRCEPKHDEKYLIIKNDPELGVIAAVYNPPLLHI